MENWRGSAYVFVRSSGAWAQQAKVLASDGTAGDYFGRSVSISGDTAVIGADGASDYRGAAYVFARTGATWAESQKLLATGGVMSDLFGYSVSISGDTAIVGAYGAGSYAGAAFVFRVAGLSSKLVAPDGSAGDNLGSSVSVRGNTAVLGASGDDARRGAVYVFVGGSGGWTLQQKLVASDGLAGDRFGASVLLSGDTVMVGAPGDDGTRGSAYVFVRSGAIWTQEARLQASDGAAGDGFGGAVALTGNTAVIGADSDDGARGSAYLFTRSGSAWTQQQKLTAADGAASDRFGNSVALAWESALVGAWGDDANRGAAYVFVRAGSGWVQQQKLLAGDGSAGDRFGSAVSLSGDTALVGASGDDGARGSAYVFLRTGTAWAQQARLQASDGVASGEFGGSVCLQGDLAMVGAGHNNSNRGASYAFVRIGGTWAESQRFEAADGASGDSFGGAVSLSGSTALIGAFQDDSGTGSAHPLTVNAGASQARYRPGIVRSGFLWAVDLNGNYWLDSDGQDRVFPFGGFPGDVPVTGDWNMSNKTSAGMFRQGFLWMLDTNGNSAFEDGVDAVFPFGGIAGDVPVTGDWNGDGRTDVGIFRQGFLWILDANGNGVFDGVGPNLDAVFAYGGITGDVPITGDWNGDGKSEVGVFRQGFLWVLDANGNRSQDAQDLVFPLGGITGDVPVTGDWDGNGITDVGVLRQGFLWLLDLNGDRQHSSPPTDLTFPFGGIAGDRPVAGKW